MPTADTVRVDAAESGEFGAESLLPAAGSGAESFPVLGAVLGAVLGIVLGAVLGAVPVSAWARAVSGGATCCACS